MESDLLLLEKATTTHLDSVINILKLLLKPKHHFLLHYVQSIRDVGPQVLNSTLKYEMKNKAFTDEAKKTNNFIDIGRSIALKHQQNAALKDLYKDNIKFGKSKMLDSSKYGCLLQRYKFHFKFSEKVECLDWLQFNSNYYKKSLFVVYKKHLFEILEILHSMNEFYFICSRVEIIGYNTFLNSIQIKLFAPAETIIKHLELEKRTSYERKKIDEKIFIIADTLDVFKLADKEV